MFGGVLNSLTRKLGQTATKGEAGKLAGLIGGEGAIAKSVPKSRPRVDYNLAPAEDTIRLYTNTKGKNVDSILEGGLKTKQRLQGYGADPSEGSVSWFETTPNLKGYGGNTIAVDVPKSTRMQKVNDTQYTVFDDIAPEHIKFVDKPLFSEYRTSDINNLIDKYGEDKVFEVFNKAKNKYVDEDELREIISIQKPMKAESVPKVMPKNSLTGKVDMTPDDLDMFREDIKNALLEGGFDDVAIDGLDHIGSTRLGTARPDSDLDLVMRYKGDAREDDVFNLLNDYVEQNGLEFNGRKVDINPIRSDDIEQYRQLLTDAGVNIDDVAPYLSGAGGGNDLLKYINTTNPEFVAKKNLGAKAKTSDYRGRPTNEIRDSIAGTKIHPDDMELMDQYIQYARNKKLRNSLSDGEQFKIENRMYDLADHYGIKLNENATDPIRDMANRFIKAMDKQNVGGK